MDRRELGRVGENTAAIRLEEEGYAVIGRNVRCGRYEIDLIAEDADYVCFVEVKTRRQYPAAAPAGLNPGDAVDRRKRESLVRAAEAWLAANPTDKIPRIDVMEIWADPASDVYRVLGIRHLENAVRKTAKFSPKRPGTR